MDCPLVYWEPFDVENWFVYVVLLILADTVKVQL